MAIRVALLALSLQSVAGEENGARRALMRRIGSVEQHAQESDKATVGEDVEAREDGHGASFRCSPPLSHSGDAWPGTPNTASTNRHTDGGFNVALINFNESIAALGDRLVKAADATDAVRACGSFYNFGDYTWCNRALPAESSYAKRNGYGGAFCTVNGTGLADSASALLDVAEIMKTRVENNGQFVALSYGIEETDPWSEMMSSMYFISPRLFDCYINSTKGPMFTDMRGEHDRNNPCENRNCYTVGYEANRVCVNNVAMERDGRKYEPLSASLVNRPPLSAFVKMDVEGSEWQVLNDLLKSPEDLDRIRTLDMEVHMFYNCNDGVPIERRVEIMEELGRVFAVSGSQIEPLHVNIQREFNGLKKANGPDYKRNAYAIYTSQGLPMEAYTISYVNRRLLKGDDTMSVQQK